MVFYLLMVENKFDLLVLYKQIMVLEFVHLMFELFHHQFQFHLLLLLDIQYNLRNPAYWMRKILLGNNRGYDQGLDY